MKRWQKEEALRQVLVRMQAELPNTVFSTGDSTVQVRRVTLHDGVFSIGWLMHAPVDSATLVSHFPSWVAERFGIRHDSIQLERLDAPGHLPGQNEG
jgi:hypothetical protein